MIVVCAVGVAICVIYAAAAADVTNLKVECRGLSGRAAVIGCGKLVIISQLNSAIMLLKMHKRDAPSRCIPQYY